MSSLVGFIQQWTLYLRPSNQIWLYYQNKKITGNCTQTTVILCLQNWKKNQTQPRYIGSKLRVNAFKLQLKMWCHLASAN